VVFYFFLFFFFRGSGINPALAIGQYTMYQASIQPVTLCINQLPVPPIIIGQYTGNWSIHNVKGKYLACHFVYLPIAGAAVPDSSLFLVLIHRQLHGVDERQIGQYTGNWLIGKYSVYRWILLYCPIAGDRLKKSRIRHRQLVNRKVSSVSLDTCVLTKCRCRILLFFWSKHVARYTM